MINPQSQLHNPLQSILNEIEIEKYKNLYQQASVAFKKERGELLKSIYNLLNSYKNVQEAFSKNAYVSQDRVESLHEEAIKELNTLFHSDKIVRGFEDSDRIDSSNSPKKQFLKRKPVEATHSTPSRASTNIFEDIAKSMAELSATQKQAQMNSVRARYNYLNDLYRSIYYYGLHPAIYQRNVKRYAILFEHRSTTGAPDVELDFVSDLDEQTLKDRFINSYKNLQSLILIHGKYVRIGNICKTTIISTYLKPDEVPFYFASKDWKYINSHESGIKFIKSLTNEADIFLPAHPIDVPLLDDLDTAALDLKNMLIIRPKTKQSPLNNEYWAHRSTLSKHQEAWRRTPYFIREAHSFTEWWSLIKNKFDRDAFISAEFKSLFEYLNKQHYPLKQPVHQLLLAIGADHINECWQKAIEKIASDPEEAITRARSLVESVLFFILEEEKIGTDIEKEDLPNRFKLVFSTLQLSPDGEEEQLFKQIMNGFKTIILGISGVRNKYGSAHGKTVEQALVKPDSALAEFMVNSCGTLCKYLLQQWQKQRK
jgi:hypothetical protein